MSSSRIPMYDLRAEYYTQKEALDSTIRRVLESGILIMGPELDAFEEEFARFCGARYAIGVGSGTAALHLALLACGVGPGDEVITVPNTDIPTTMAITHCGASIAWVDVDPRTFTIAPERIAERITPKTKAILVVHLFGHPADMDPIMAVAGARGLAVIEDAALATGAEYRGRKVGTIGDVGCFSLAPTKVFGAFGDAGVVTTNNEDIANAVKVLRNYGHDLRMDAHQGLSTGTWRWNLVAEGFNERLDSLQAAILRTKLLVLHERIARRRQLAQLYTRLLAGVDLVTPYEAPDVKHVYRAYPILVADRDRLRGHLAGRGIATQAYYTPLLHLQPVYARLGYTPGSFPAAEAVADRLVCLPVFPTMREDQIAEVVETVKETLPKVHVTS